jgi:DNA-binding CsgD family transcriptional regulator
MISEITGHVRELISYDEVGALDGLTADEIAQHPPEAGDLPLVTELKDGTRVVVSGRFMEKRLEDVAARLDNNGYDLLVLLTTGIFRKFHTSTPLLHGQLAVDEWISSFVMGFGRLGVVFPLRKQASNPANLHHYGILIQNSCTVAFSGAARRVDEMSAPLQGSDFILMHSVGYTQEMAECLASEARKPIVTARRVIAGALHLRLMESQTPGEWGNPQENEVDLVKRLPAPSEPLTKREYEVLSLVLEGHSNKIIAKKLGISHRTVEIHRGRALVKHNAMTPTQLIRRALMQKP